MRGLPIRLGTGVLALFLVACGGKPEVVGSEGSGSRGGSSSIDASAGGGGVIIGGDAEASGGQESDACLTCVPTDVCSDAKITGAEECDDGNSVPGDGCDGVCRIEPGYTCPDPGKECVYTVKTECGNSRIEGSEACDDGNAQNGDGCSQSCAVEGGYVCTRPGDPCTPSDDPVVCGDGAVGAGEQCDDGNTAGSDGCSADCASVESGWTCPTPGSACVALEYCGDGIVQASIDEACDDGDAVPGDGCSGICTIEPGYACTQAGKPCVNIWVCGNGKVDPGESCDDSNVTGGDGCAADCTQVEAGFTCPKAPDGTGGACTPTKNACGDAVLVFGEECDDGNTASTDGCSSTCKVESGFTCPNVGQLCERTAYCGNSKLDLSIGENCDDGNRVGGDGCSALCKTEAGYDCATPGSSCVSNVKCGDGIINSPEQCDDGNKVGADGCSATCQLEAGWTCPVAAGRCIAKACGDGIKVGREQCDDGNVASNDGCSATCVREAGFACTGTVRSVCRRTVCGDSTAEAFEQCDDGNRIPYDGCSPTCTIEPKCSGGQCTAVCGDGLKFPQEGCDDGNKVSGDGCSSTCTLEVAPNYTGYRCSVVTRAPPSTLAIPVLYRDFLYAGTTTPGPGHPDFEAFLGTVTTGLVQSTLGADGKPVFASSQGVITSADSFYAWYHSTLRSGGANTFQRLVYLDRAGNPTTLNLASIGGGVYQYSSANFFPVDGLGWNAGANPQVSQGGQDNGNHNFCFTSELRYPFTYVGGERLDFTGDDDVFVFINGRLAVDLGGLHEAANGSVTLNAATAAQLGLTANGMYEIALFQAERHTVESNYRLSLSGFLRAVTVCTPVCGDGIVTPDEVCDLGTGPGKNDGSYGACTADCRGRGPYCGDGTTNPNFEQCDSGTSFVSYGGTTRQCGPGCKWAPYCGDGLVSNGEACDEGTGAGKNGAGYGHCTATCELGPRCGDGIPNGAEQCDAGINNGSSASPCNADCTLKCGNGVVEGIEECDDGLVANTGGYGKCNADCSFGPRCGDGIKNGAEQCDDGKNDGSYGTCSPGCVLGPYCGDGEPQTPPESCDKGSANSSTAYGQGLCTNRCTPAPYCGDRAVDGANGEQCDDGKNDGSVGSCTTDCKAFVALSSCGDGKVQPPEQCDTGASNGTGTCDARCRSRCGNGIKDSGEQCDNGVNDGSYGTCTSACKLAAYCGDGTANGPELCDFGPRNLPAATAYGPGLCTTACTIAPYCGDGRIQSANGEECDGSSRCGTDCKIIVLQ